MKLAKAAWVVLAIAGVSLPVDRADAGAKPYWSDVEHARIFETAVTASGLRPAIGQQGAFTLFLPSDEVLEREGSAELLRGVYLTPGNRARLADLLAYHIVPGQKITLAATDPFDVTTLSGDILSIERDGERSLLNGHIAVIRSIDLGDAVVHLVSGLLWADLVQEEKNLASDASAAPFTW